MKMDNQYILAIIGSLGATLLMALAHKKKKNRKKRVWVKEWLAKQSLQGVPPPLQPEIKAEDIAHCVTYLGMDLDTFQYVLNKVSPLIRRQQTHMRTPTSAKDRLLVTLRFLATGETYSALQYSSRIPQCSLSKLIPETCAAIYASLKDEFLKVPGTEEDWKTISDDYEKVWNVHNTIGSLDGRHIRLKGSKTAGTQATNFKVNSVALMTLADAHGKFIFVDIDTNSRLDDAEVYSKSAVKRCLSDRAILNIPTQKVLPSTNIALPYVVLADDVFPLSYNLMKPYPFQTLREDEKVFNYRIAQGRSTVENSFDILGNRFRIFLTTIQLSPQKIVVLTQAACVLHNLLLEKRRSAYMEKLQFDLEEGDQMPAENTEMIKLMPQIDMEYNWHGAEIRDAFKTFYNGINAAPWQNSYINL